MLKAVFPTIKQGDPTKLRKDFIIHKTRAREQPNAAALYWL
jgi:hypothetical protein